MESAEKEEEGSRSVELALAKRKKAATLIEAKTMIPVYKLRRTNAPQRKKFHAYGVRKKQKGKGG